MVEHTDRTPIDPGNAPMREYWGGSRGHSWVRRSVAYDGQLRPYTEELMHALKPAPGEAALDVGCGTGFTTRELAAAVGSDGTAVGVDLSNAMVAGARAAADVSGLERGLRPTFAVADVQVADLPALNGGRPYDVVASRFGVMFFADTAAAFTNLAGATAPGGRLGFICWASLDDNPWFTGPRDAAAPILESVAPAAPETPDAPGPFSMSDPERITETLRSAGWEGVALRTLTDELYLGGPGSVDAAIDFLASGSGMAPTLEAHPDLLDPIRAALTEELTPHHDGRGVRYPAAAHLVTAVKP